MVQVAYVSIPKDLTVVKSKFIMGLTKRQTVCFGSAAAAGLLLFFLLRGAVIGWVAIEIVSAIFFFALFNMAGDWTHMFGRWITPEFRIFLRLIYFLLGAWSGISAVLVGIAISKSVVKVYEMGVIGKGISKWFYSGDVRSFDFILTYDQVSVALNGGKMIVHAPGTQYNVYVSNGTEIQNTIHKQKNQFK